MHFKIYCLVGLAIGQIMFSCNNPKSEQQHENKTDSVAIKEVTPEPPAKISNFNYIAWPIKSSDSLKKVFNTLSDHEQKILFCLNRVDKKHIKNIDTILVPDVYDNDLLAYSPFPAKLNLLDAIEKFVIFSYPIQAYAVYENGNMIKWGPTNMGKKATKTPEGLFFTNWKGKEIKSSVNKSWILKWNFNISNLGGVGWHQYALPGYPASHSCLRLLEEDAKWLYDWADQWILKNGIQIAKGTPTVVFGDYPWGERRPWKAMLENPKANNISEEEINEIIKPYMDKINSAKEERALIINQKTDTTIASTHVIP